MCYAWLVEVNYYIIMVYENMILHLILLLHEFIIAIYLTMNNSCKI